jgi:hypothetical protein
MRHALPRALIGALAIIIGCSDSPTQPDFGYGVVHIHAANPSNAPGSTAEFTIDNVGPNGVNYLPCASGIERQVNGAWQSTDDFHLDPDCDAAQVSLPIGTSGRLYIPIPAAVSPGTYRAHFDNLHEIGNGGRQLPTVRSDDFQVGGAAGQ